MIKFLELPTRVWRRVPMQGNNIWLNFFCFVYINHGTFQTNIVSGWIHPIYLWWARIPLMSMSAKIPVSVLEILFFFYNQINNWFCACHSRLPIIQGGTFSFFVPTIAILKTNFEDCSVAMQQNMTSSEIEEVWQVRMREIQGAIAVSAIFQVVIGFTGNFSAFFCTFLNTLFADW